jgi:anti-sigma factor RsiW
MNRTIHEIEPEEVMAYLDGELEASRASEVAAHIAGCAECSAAAADLRAISGALAKWSVEPSAMAVEKITQARTAPSRPPLRESSRLVRLTRRAWASPVSWRVATVAAVVCLVALLATQNLTHFASRPVPWVAALQKRTTALSTATELSTDTVLQQQAQEQGELADSLQRDDVPVAPATPAAAPASAPMIARTAAITLVAAKLDEARASVEKLLARHRGFSSQMTLDKSNESSPSLDATLQVPAAELDATLSELRGLGRVTTESQGGEDVSDQHVDLAARLHNSRETEQRLLDILRTRTGKVSDVLAVEQQISQTRGEIEQMEAQLANLDKRVAYASIRLQIAEEYKAPAAANGSVALRLRNAIVGGYRDAVDSLLALAVFLLSAGPTLLLWAFILFWPARAIWRRRKALRSAVARS